MSLWMICSKDTNFLSHHGIPQQKWGIRRGPPYPLARTSDGRVNSKRQAMRKENSDASAITSRPVAFGSKPSRRSIRQAAKLERQDQKWIRKNYEKLYRTAYKKSRREMDQYVKKDLNKRLKDRNSSGKESLTYINDYNRKLAEVMNRNLGEVKAPSGRIVCFIPKRGEVGVHAALADPSQNLKSYNRGIYSDGRVAYKQEHVKKV